MFYDISLSLPFASLQNIKTPFFMANKRRDSSVQYILFFGKLTREQQENIMLNFSVRVL